MTTIELKTNAALKRTILAALPNYKKHKVFLSVFSERGMTINSYWDGGSRDEYTLLDLETMTRKALPTSTHPFYDVARYGIQGTFTSMPTICPACSRRYPMSKPKWELSAHEIAQAITDSEYLGLCRICGSVTECVEPDARNYKCHACGRMEVFGLEELLLMGEVEVS